MMALQRPQGSLLLCLAELEPALLDSIVALTARKDRKSLRLVHSVMRRSANRCTTKLTGLTPANSGAAPPAPQRFPGATELQLDRTWKAKFRDEDAEHAKGLHMKLFELLPPNAPLMSLRKLTLPLLDAGTAAAVLAACPAAEELFITYSSDDHDFTIVDNVMYLMYIATALLRNLRRLHMEPNQIGLSNIVLPPLSRCTGLEHLCLTLCHGDAAGLQPLWRLTTLRSLRAFWGEADDTDSALDPGALVGLSNLRNLTELELGSSEGWPCRHEAGLEVALPHLTALRSLALPDMLFVLWDGCVYDVAVRRLVPALRQLRALERVTVGKTGLCVTALRGERAQGTACTAMCCSSAG